MSLAHRALVCCCRNAHVAARRSLAARRQHVGGRPAPLLARETAQHRTQSKSIRHLQIKVGSRRYIHVDRSSHRQLLNGKPGKTRLV